MTLFKKILDLKQSDLKNLERRLDKRYPVGPTFPLTASLIASEQTIPTRIHDMSAGGIALVVSPELYPAAAGATLLLLRLGQFALTAGVGIRHARAADGGLVCGIALKFAEFETQKAYLQLTLPVAIGGSLAQVDDSLVRQNEPRYHKLAYEGASNSRLTIWRKHDARETPEIFEFQIDDYFVRGNSATGVLHAFSLVDDVRPHRIKDTTPLFQIDSRLDEEIKQLFRWTVMNIRDSVPADVRSFLSSFAL